VRIGLLAIAVLLAAGCAQPKDGGPRETMAPAPASSASAPASAASSSASMPGPAANGTVLPSFTLDDCRNFGAVFPVAMESARAVLPDGFEPVASPSDPAGGATLYVLGLTCTASSVDGASTGPADVLYAELAVVPPADQKLPGLDDCTVPVLFASGNAAWAEHTGQGDVIVAATLGGASMTLRGALASAEPAVALGEGGFAAYGVQDGALQTVLRAHASAGTAQDAAATLEATGAPAPIGDARPASRGFSAAGFSLSYAPA
jgi:hypothetical protein